MAARVCPLFCLTHRTELKENGSGLLCLDGKSGKSQRGKHPTNYGGQEQAFEVQNGAGGNGKKVLRKPPTLTSFGFLSGQVDTTATTEGPILFLAGHCSPP